MYVDPDVLEPDDISSDIIFTILLLVSSCKYKSCNPITSFDCGIADTSIIGVEDSDFAVPIIFTGYNLISPRS